MSTLTGTSPAHTANHQLKELIEESGLPYDGVARAVKAVALESGQRPGTNKSAASGCQ